MDYNRVITDYCLNLIEQEWSFLIANKKNIKLAKCAGFCYGVKRAVELTKEIKQNNPQNNVYILGQLIHNNQVIEELNSIGIKTVDNINEIPKSNDNICIIRTHGATPQIIKQLQDKGCQIIDATCNDVKIVQEKAHLLSNNGYKVVIIGKPDHPEVIGIKAHAELNSTNSAIIISCAEEVYKNIKEIKAAKKIGVVVQTTQKTDNLKQIIPLLIEQAKELKVYNTICATTSQRQKEAKKIAQSVDLMIIVGSKTSANTSHLAELIRETTQTIHIETHNELEVYEELIEKALHIGVTAGASTPENVINNVIKKIGG